MPWTSLNIELHELRSVDNDIAMKETGQFFHLMWKVMNIPQITLVKGFCEQS